MKLNDAHVIPGCDPLATLEDPLMLQSHLLLGACVMFYS